MASFSAPSFLRILKTLLIIVDIELCQLKNGYNLPTSLATPPFSSHYNELIISFARVKTNLISIAGNWINKENSRYAVVFSIFPFFDHVNKYGSNFNKDFSFLSKSNLKCLFVSGTMCWLQFNANSHESRSHRLHNDNLECRVLLISQNRAFSMPQSSLMSMHGHPPFYFEIEVLIW